LVEEIALDERTYAEAQATFEGIERRTAWYIERRITVDGRSDLRPMRPVVVRSPQVVQTGKTAPQQGWEQYDGLWIVRSVHTRMRFDRDRDFTSEVVLVRDARGPTTNVRQRRSSVFTRFEDLPPPRLLNDRWVSSWKQAA
jgi:hypothetical protein